LGNRADVSRFTLHARSQLRRPAEPILHLCGGIDWNRHRRRRAPPGTSCRLVAWQGGNGFSCKPRILPHGERAQGWCAILTQLDIGPLQKFNAFASPL
jgi:hypothetical protein